ncbi:MAG: photosynthetic reaction center subunit H [Acetobacteraceae bacterium]
MPIGALTGYIDVAQLTLYAFWLFFAGLIWYLLRENKREGYPLIALDRVGSRVVVEGLPPTPAKKSFLMPDGSVVMVPRDEVREPLKAAYAGKFPGAPLVPVGEPLTAGMGPGAYARRADVPDHAFDDGLPKIVPLRAATAFFLASEDPDLRGYAVLGADGVQAGTISDAWIDRSEVVIRYLEVQLALPDATRAVLLPMNYLTIDSRHRVIRTDFIRGGQFALVPAHKSPDQVTLLEEDMITAFFAGGMMYSAPGREGPLL